MQQARQRACILPELAGWGQQEEKEEEEEEEEDNDDDDTSFFSVSVALVLVVVACTQLLRASACSFVGGLGGCSK